MPTLAVLRETRSKSVGDAHVARRLRITLTVGASTSMRRDDAQRRNASIQSGARHA